MNKEKIYSIVFILINIPIWFMNSFCSRLILTQLNGEPLPGLTELINSIEHIWPPFFMICFFIAFISAQKSKVKAQHIILISALLEVFFIMVVTCAYALPFYVIGIKL